MKALTFPMTIAETAKAAKVSRTTIGRWLDKGFLKADYQQSPIVVTGGRPPISLWDWKQAVKGVGLKDGLWGMEPDGRVEALLGTVIVRASYTRDPNEAGKRINALTKVADAQNGVRP